MWQKSLRLFWKWIDMSVQNVISQLQKSMFTLISVVVVSSWKFFNYKIIGNDIKPWLVQILLYWHPFGKENITIQLY